MGDQGVDAATRAGSGAGGIVIWLLVAALLSIVPIFLTYKTMIRKANSGVLGIVLGVFLDWIGFIIALVMPARAA